VFSLDALANITSGDVESYFSLHAVPPKLSFHILVHLGASGMDRVRGIMGLLQNGLLQLLDVRNT
jgi:hypothetical protein